MEKCWICKRIEKDLDTDPSCMFEQFETDIGKVDVCVPCCQIIMKNAKDELKLRIEESGVMDDE